MGLLEQETLFNFSQMIADMGRSIIIRNLTVQPGPVPYPNPPSFSGLVVNGNALAGASSIGFRGTQLNGRLVAGDKFTLGASTYTISGGPYTSSSNAIAGVNFTPVLVANANDGDAAALSFAADVTLNALVTAFPARLVNGTSIQMTDRQIRFRAADLPWTPVDTNKAFLEGDQYSIISVHAAQMSGTIYAYFCQIRR